MKDNMLIKCEGYGTQMPYDTLNTGGACSSASPSCHTTMIIKIRRSFDDFLSDQMFSCFIDDVPSADENKEWDTEANRKQWKEDEKNLLPDFVDSVLEMVEGFNVVKMESAEFTAEEWFKLGGIAKGKLSLYFTDHIYFEETEDGRRVEKRIPFVHFNKVR